MPKFDAPFTSEIMRVEPSFIDYNGHMNVAYYVVLFDRFLDVVFERLGLGESYLKEQQHSFFAAEMHINYRRELKLGAPVRTTFRLIDHDEKRLHFYQEMFHAEEGYLACAAENLSLHVDMRSRKVAPFLPGPLDVLRALMAAHSVLPPPDFSGRKISLRKPGT